MTSGNTENSNMTIWSCALSHINGYLNISNIFDIFDISNISNISPRPRSKVPIFCLIVGLTGLEKPEYIVWINTLYYTMYDELQIKIKIMFVKGLMDLFTDYKMPCLVLCDVIDFSLLTPIPIPQLRVFADIDSISALSFTQM